MDVSGINASYEAIKNIKNVFTSIIDSKIDIEVKKQIEISKEKLGSVQDTLFHLRNDLADLQTENENLKKQILEYNEWNNISNDYTLVETKGSAVVYEYNKDPKHYICPNCFNNKERQILQNKKDSNGSFLCSKCESIFYINESKPRTNVRRGTISKSWRI